MAYIITYLEGQYKHRIIEIMMTEANYYNHTTSISHSMIYLMIYSNPFTFKSIFKTQLSLIYIFCEITIVN